MEDTNMAEEIFRTQLPYNDDHSNTYVLPSQLNGLDAPIRDRPKAFQDRIHGQMKFPPAIWRLINTRHVQRLRDLKQMGTSSMVYPNATHSRFEHSLGVAHLGMKLLKQIVENHSLHGIPLDLPEKDMWCVGIAGLCHDLGHGPFSHMFETHVNLSRSRKYGDKAVKYCHEDQSIAMLEDMWEKNITWLYSDTYGFTREDLNFIKVLINGLKIGAPWPDNVGRPPTRRFLTDIIANHRSGLDVDKLDYLCRDSSGCFGQVLCPPLDRLFQGALAMEMDGEWQICYDTKLDGEIAGVFAERARMHRVVYQHRVAIALNYMYLDAFQEAEAVPLIFVGDKEYCLSETVNDVEAFLQTTDWVEKAIMFSASPARVGLAPKILAAIYNRDIYRSLGYCRLKPEIHSVGTKKKPVITADTVFGHLKDANLLKKIREWETDNERESIEVITVKITNTASGMNTKQAPIDLIGFYNDRKLGNEPKLLDGKRYTASDVKTEPEVKLIALTRMPVSTDELNLLCEAFDKALCELKTIKDHFNYSVAPADSPRRSQSLAYHSRGDLGDENSCMSLSQHMIHTPPPDVSPVPKRPRLESAERYYGHTPRRQ